MQFTEEANMLLNHSLLSLHMSDTQESPRSKVRSPRYF